MHALMSVDPDARALRFWEVMYPSPPPGLAGPDDASARTADADWREINAKMPKWLHSHPYNDMLGDGLPEDERTWAFDFRVMTPTAWWRVPMQIAGRRTGHRRNGAVPATQGDAAATAIRPPAKILGTQRLSRLPAQRDVRDVSRRDAGLAAPRPGAGGRVAHDDDGRHHRRHRRARRSARRGQEAPRDDPRQHRQHDEQPDGRRPTDPARPLHRLHRRSGRDGTALLRIRRSRARQRRPSRRCGTYLADNRGDRHGKFRYSTQLLIDIGEDLAALHEEFRPFRERFGVEIENRG